MKLSVFTDTQELLINQLPVREYVGNTSSSDDAEADGKYPRELNKRGLAASMIISVVVMVILLVSTL